MRRGAARGIGLLVGVAADQLIADPSVGHPVALFGRAAGHLENRLWADSRGRGAAFTLLSVGAITAAGRLVERPRATWPRRGPWWTAATTAVACWTVLGGASLRREAAAIAGRLDRRDLPAAREQLTHLVGRDPSSLGETDIARASIESVAENTSDAVVAPLFWGAVAGVPGLLGYRAINTLDAMVGHRSCRYREFGWASARLDDVANLVPARLTALCTAAVARCVRARPADVARIALRDGRRHPSPNAGWCESAFAAALGITLGGQNTYGERVESRPRLGDGRPPRAGDIARANRLSFAVTVLAAAVAAALAAASTREGVG
jgi:adenosylcobinamide-phosphate synthase